MPDKDIKVLHVVGGMDIGGTETMLMNLYREVYKEVQFDFISYYGREGYYDKEIKELGGKIIMMEESNKIGQVNSIKNLIKIIKEGNYDVVHAHTLFNCGIAMMAAKLGGAKIRISHAHTNLDFGASFIKKIYISGMRIIIKTFSTSYLACSDSAGKYLFGNKIINNKDYHVLPNYVDYKKILKREKNESLRNELKLNKGNILVGHIGRMVDAKNHSFLIDILDKMIKKDNRVKAVLVGDGPLREEIEEKINNLGLKNNIFLLGLRNDIDVILNNLDLFIFPSIYEGLGLVMLEAQAAGLPCLVSEAIQPEADLNIGLVKKINLDLGKEYWSEEAIKLVNKKIKDNKVIEEAFVDKGYELNQIIDKLLSVYRIN